MKKDFNQGMHKNYVIDIIFFISLIFLAFTYSIGKDQIFINRQGDAALFEQATQNIYIKNTPTSNVFANTQNYIDKRFFEKSFNELMHSELEAPIELERNILGFHAYYILFLVAPLIKYFTASQALTLVQISSAFSFLFIAYWIARKELQKPLLALTLLPLIFLHPVFIGNLVGQFYPDRLFLPFALFLCYQAYRHEKIYYIAITAFFTLLINERAALIGGLILLFVPSCGHNIRDKKIYIFCAAMLGFILLSYAYFQKTYILQNVYYDGYFPGTLTDLIHRFSLPNFAKNSITLLVVNLPFLLLAFGNKRLATVALLLMLPNLVGNIGGAEKTGWTTHYHSYYFPVVVFSGVVGYLTLLEKLGPKLQSFKIKKWITSLFILFLPTCLIFMEFNRQSSMHLVPNISQSIEPWRTYSCYRKNCPTGLSYKSIVQNSIAKDSLVSTDELGMALIYDKAQVGFFPVAANRADYILIPCQMVSDQGSHPENKIDPQWFIKNGFNPEISVKFDGIDRCLFKKKKLSN